MGEVRGIVKEMHFILQNQGFLVCFCCPFDIKTELKNIAKSVIFLQNMLVLLIIRKLIL